jgi:uncharacterized protein YjbJ (UPF0337 family)
MNADQIHGHWRKVKGWALERWGRVTHDPWKRIAGRREQLLGGLEASLASSRPERSGDDVRAGNRIQ